MVATASIVTGKCPGESAHFGRICRLTVKIRAMGYFINFYNITQKSSDQYFASVANDRLEPWLGSSIYSRPEGNCRKDGVDQCHPESLVCHYMTAEAMSTIGNLAYNKSSQEAVHSRPRII